MIGTGHKGAEIKNKDFDANGREFFNYSPDPGWG
jgi:hypothetical protein